MTQASIRVALIGVGEVGGIFARDLRAGGITRLTGFDPATQGTDGRQARAAREHGVTLAPSAAEAAAQADLVIVAVTAASSFTAAQATLPGLGHRPFVLDVNSVSPATKQRTANAVEAAGGRYVEAAVMTSVPPHGIASPMLLGGPHAEAFAELAGTLGMRVRVFSTEIGKASAVKMCRSILIKGLEALLTESMLAARVYGIEREVLASLGDTIPHPDWPAQARYMMSRPLIHGRRRAEEMREVAVTVADAGLEPILSEAIVRRQDWSADQGAALRDLTAAPGLLEDLCDAVLRAAVERARTG